jgi:acetyl esterase/lipase
VNLVPGPLTDGTRAFPHPPPRAGRLGGLEYDNVVYSCEPGYRPLFLDLRVPLPGTGLHPLIVWIHGGGWIYGSRRRLPPHLFDNAVHDQMLDAGYAVAAVDYRLAREAGFAGMLLDVRAAVRWLRGRAGEFDLDPERVVLWGESAGGHLALMAAMCTGLDGAQRTGEHLEQPETPQAVVDWYGPTDLVAMSRLDLGGDSEEVGRTEQRPEVVLEQHGDWSYEELSAVTHVRRGVPPVFVAHGTDDQIVSVDHSRELVARLRGAGAVVDYLEVPGADHVWRGAPSVPDIVTASLRFVATALDQEVRNARSAAPAG